MTPSPFSASGDDCRLLTRADRAAFIGVMASAFQSDPAPLYFLGAARSVADLERFAAFVFDQAGLLGQQRWGLFVSGQLVAVSVFEPPDHSAAGRMRLLLALLALLPRVLAAALVLPRGSLRRMNDYYRLSRQAAAPGAWHYLSLIGVAAGQQGKGYGARLLERHISAVDSSAASRGLLLDTENPDNLAWYARYGFTVRARVRLDGLDIFCLQRPSGGRPVAVSSNGNRFTGEQSAGGQSAGGQLAGETPEDTSGGPK